MAESSLKQQFLRLLRKVMLRSGVRQRDLVGHLGISASAASQMLSGAILPSQKRLDQIFELVCPELADAEELQRMLYWLRSGRNRLPSVKNRRLFMLRCRNGFSVSQLAAASGITEARLRRLESVASSLPSVEEAEELALVLKCSAGELMDEVAYIAPSCPPVEAAEEDTVSLPMITVSDMAEYSPADHIGSFAFDRAREFIERGLISVAAAAVLCAGAKGIHALLPGIYSLTLGDCKPDDFRELELCCSTDNEFFVCGLGAGLFEKPAPGTEFRWRLPVLEISYIPKS